MNSKQKIIGSLLLVTASFTLAPPLGEAATFEENEAVNSLCQGTSVIVGKVITAVRDEPQLDAFCANSTWECSAPGDSCHDAPHNIQLEVKVLEVLGAPTHDEINTLPVRLQPLRIGESQGRRHHQSKNRPL